MTVVFICISGKPSHEKNVVTRLKILEKDPSSTKAGVGLSSKSLTTSGTNPLTSGMGGMPLKSGKKVIVKLCNGILDLTNTLLGY